MTDLTVTITGATGQLGRALIARLSNCSRMHVQPIGRASNEQERRVAVETADRIVHLAGVTRASDPDEFTSGNVEITQQLARLIDQGGHAPPTAFASSIRAMEETIYGRTKRMAEDILIDMAARTGTPLTIFRLPSFFGAWSRPNHASAVATFCHQVVQGQRPKVLTPDAPITLVHLDDVVRAFGTWLDSPPSTTGFVDVTPTYTATVGEVADIICRMADHDYARNAAGHPNGLIRGLHQTYRTHLHR